MKNMEYEIKVLSDRIAEIERRLGIKTEVCAGYCGQPTSEPDGMCQACRERDGRESRRPPSDIPRYYE